MRSDELFDLLRTIDGPSEITLSPGPFYAAVNQDDAIAADLVDWLSARMPADATWGDLEYVMLGALCGFLLPLEKTSIELKPLAAALVEWLRDRLPDGCPDYAPKDVLLSALFWLEFLALQYHHDLQEHVRRENADENDQS